MDYKEKYEEALERAKKLQYGQDTVHGDTNCMEYIFPELRESEDERIKNEIINFIKDNTLTYTNRGSEIQMKWIAWLEKQGEQKLTDKVEPKFKVGDWVVCNNSTHYTFQIYKVEDKFYYVDSCEVKPISYVDSDYHLWTIADAKDGDVLVASDSSIFIFKGTIDWGCKHYAALTTDGAVKFNKGLKHYWETSTAVHPATKEQRDTLFKAMADDGYTFDFVKKELKKIEQNPVIEMKSAEESLCIDSDTYNKIVDECIYGDNEQKHVDMIQWTGDNLKDVIAFTGKSPNFDKWFKSQEEYENYVHAHNNIFKLFNEDGSHCEIPVGAWIVKTPDGYNVASKYRFVQKPEWSEEDEYCINQLIVFCENCMVQDSSAIKCADWLKSLRPQTRWKPTEEQIKTLEKWLEDTRYKTRYVWPIFESLYKQLKAL